MNVRPSILVTSIAALLSLGAEPSHAVDWILNTGGDWATAGNWNAAIPNGAGAVANFSTDISADATINLGADRTVGTLSFGDPTPSNLWILANNNLNFDVNTGAPTVIVAAGVTAQINSQTRGNWDGGLNLSGNGTLILNGNTLDANSVRNTWTVNAGAALQYAQGGALGWRGFGNETIILAGGQLRVGGAIDPGTERFIIAGNGNDGTGAVVSNIAAAQNAMRHLTLSANASVGGTQRVDVRLAAGNGAGITGVLDLGGFTLTKLGVNNFILNNTTVTNGNINIDAGILGFEGAVVKGTGTVTVNTGGTFQVWRDGNIQSVDFTRPIVANGGSFDYNTSASQPVYVAAPITLKSTTNVTMSSAGARAWLGFLGNIGEDGGSFGLNKLGGSLLILGGTNTYTGPTTVNSGGLVLLPGSSLGNTPVSVSPGATLAGAGNIGGSVNIDGTLLLGSAAGVTTGDLVLGNGATVGIAGNGVVGRLSAPTVTFPAGGTRTLGIDLSATGADRINATAPGGLTLDGTNNINVITGGAGWVSGSYPIFGYTGALGGVGIPSLFNLTPTGRHTVTFAASAAGIDLVVVSPGNTVWTASTNGSWDGSTTNWQLSTAPGTPIAFLAQDNVVFDDTATNGAVSLVSAQAPAGITFNNATTAYTLTGVGSITNGGLTKRGTGTATLGTTTANSFVGPTEVEAGTLVLNYTLATQLAAASTINVANGATLRFLHNDGDITIANTFLGAGTIEFDPKGSGAGTSRSISLSGSSSTFTGTIRLAPTAGATMRLNAPKADQIGSGPIIIENGGQLFLSGEKITNPITINGAPHNGGFLEANGTSFGALRIDNFSDVAGPITVNGMAKFSAHNSTGYISGNISGGDVTFMGTNFANGNTLILSGTNNYGATTVNGGGTVTGSITLRLIVGNGGTTGTLGTGPITVTGSGDATNGLNGVMRFDRADGYVMLPGQNITGTGLLSRTFLEFDTLGAGFISNGGAIDLVGAGAVASGGQIRVGMSRANTTVTINSVLRANGLIVGFGMRNSTLNLIGPANVSVNSVAVGTFQNSEGALGSVINIQPGSTLNVATTFFLGEQNGITGTAANQTGGDVTIAGHLRVAHWPNETANYNISAGTLTLPTPPGAFAFTTGATEVPGVIYLGIDGQGMFTQTGGTVTTAAVVLDNRANTGAGNNMATGNDTYTLSGGTLVLTDTSGVISRFASAAFVWNGGTIRAGVSTNLDSDLINVTAPSTLDTNGLLVTLWGPLAGNGGLTLLGPGTLRVADRNGGATTVTGGGTGGGSLGANGVNFPAGSTIIYDRAASVTWSGVLSGGGSLLKSNTGTLTLTGANTYTGATTVDGGALVAAGGLAPTGTVTVNAATFGAAGAIGALTHNTGSSIRPGASLLDSEVATINAPSLTVNGGDLRVNFNASMTLWDKLTIAGLANYTAASTITPTFAGAPIAGSYPVVTAGTLTLGVTPTVVVPGGNARFTVGLDTTSVPNTIQLTVTGAPKNLQWTGAIDANWDTNLTQNWTDGVIPETFFSFDSVTFPDGPVNRFISIAATGVSAGSIVFNNTIGNDYFINGPGAITSGAITKTGDGMVTISNSNTHSGPTLIQGGQIVLGTNLNPLGNNPAVTVAAGGTLNVNGQTGATATVRYDVSIAGDGVPGQAAIWNGGAGVTNNPIYRSITLTADATMGGTGRYDLNGGTVGGTGVTFNGGTFTLRKVGSNEQWWAPNPGATVGNIIVDGGTFGVQSSNNLGSNAHSFLVNSGGQLVTFSNVTNSKPIILNGGLLAANNNTGTWTGPVTLNGFGTSNRIGTIGGVGVTLQGQLTGAEGFEKTGPGIVELQNATNNWGGTTLVTAGILRVAASGVLSPATTLDLNGGTFDANGIAQTVAGLRGFAGTLTSNTAAMFTTNQAADTTLSAAMTGLLALVKTGPGSLTLNGVGSTTAGPTTVAAGTLVVNSSLTNSLMSVNGGTLGGTGPLGVVNVTAGTVDPGSGPGTLTTAGFSLTSVSTLRFELAQAGIAGGGVNDLISAGGSLTLDGTLEVTELPGFTDGTYRLFDYLGGLTNNTLDLSPAFLAVHPGSFIDVGVAQQVNLVVIPEPGTLAALVAGLGPLLFRRRREKLEARAPRGS